MKSKNNKKLAKMKIKEPKESLGNYCGLISDQNQEEMIEKSIKESKDAMHLDNLDFCGLKSKEGKLKLRSKYNIKKQAMMHSVTLKEEKKRKKLLKRQGEIKQKQIASRKEIKTKQVRNKEDLEEHRLDKLIRNYEYESTVNVKRKWYDN